MTAARSASTTPNSNRKAPSHTRFACRALRDLLLTSPQSRTNLASLWRSRWPGRRGHPGDHLSQPLFDYRIEQSVGVRGVLLRPDQELVVDLESVFHAPLTAHIE